MTEEIYIDGVNVSDCEFYNENYCNNWIDSYGDYIHKCNDLETKDCYYKQLQRLKQENEKLKEEIQSQKGLITVGGKQQYEMTLAYDKCKTALEEIREMCNQHLEAKEICYATQVIDKIEEVLGNEI